MDFEQAFSMSNIQLDPRLQEYLNRKTFNRQNDIRPNIPEEQEFSISKEDRNIIKRHLSGKKRLYSKTRTGNSDHFVEPAPCPDDFFTNDDAFKKDPRYKRIQKKMESHKKAQAQIRNFDGIDEDYEIFHRSNPYDDPMNPNVKRPSRIAKPYDDPKNFDESEDLMYSVHGDENREKVSGNLRNLRGIYQRGDDSNNKYDDSDLVMLDSRDMVLGNSKGEKDRGRYMYNPNDKRPDKRRSESSYNHRPNISFRNRLIPQQVNGGLDHNHSVNDIIGNLDEYTRNLEDTYDYIEAEVDPESKSMRPCARSGSRREQYNGYKAIPYGYGGGLADISVEDSLRGGIRDSRRKTTGFKNTFEHQFDYIDSDISDPNHTVEMRPQNTRGANKVIARPNSRAARSERGIRARHDMEYAREEATGSRESHAQQRGYANPNRDVDDYQRNRYHR
jgi:hypothetical protein